MFVEEIMRAPVITCSMSDSLDKVAGLMWDGDCGAVVVVEVGVPVAMITDRDICMAVYTSGAKLADIRVSTAASRVVYSVRDTDSLDVAETLMRDAQVRRVPVVDGAGQLVGVITLNDLVGNAATLGRRHHALSAESLVRTAAAIGTAPHAITSVTHAGNEA